MCFRQNKLYDLPSKCESSNLIQWRSLCRICCNGRADSWLVPPGHHDYVNAVVNCLTEWKRGRIPEDDICMVVHLNFVSMFSLVFFFSQSAERMRIGRGKKRVEKERMNEWEFFLSCSYIFKKRERTELEYKFLWNRSCWKSEQRLYLPPHSSAT